MSPRIVATLLGAATIAGALLRLLDLSFESLWIDEIWSGYLVSGSPADVVRRLIAEDNHPPLYHLLQWPFPRIFSVDVGLRLPSAIAGIVSIPLLFAVGRRLFDEPTGLLAAGLLALSPFAVHASRDARFYSLLLCLSLVAFLAFLRLRARQDRGSGILFGIALAAVLYTQYIGGLFVLALLFAAWLERGEVRRGAFLAAAIALLLFLPWALAARGGVGNVMGNFWVPPPTPTTVAATIGGLAVLGRNPWSWPLVPAVLVVLGWVAAAAFGAWRARERFAVRTCLLLFLVPVTAELLISPVRPLFLARTLITIVPPILLLGAAGARHYPRPRLAALVLLLTLLPGSLALHLVREKEDWRGAIGYLAKHIRTAEPIVVDPFHRQAVRHYGYDDAGVRVAPIVLLPPQDTVEDLPALIRERLGFEPASFWLVIRTCDPEDVRTRDLLVGIMPITASFERNDAGVFRFSDPEKR